MIIERLFATLPVLSHVELAKGATFQEKAKELGLPIKFIGLGEQPVVAPGDGVERLHLRPARFAPVLEAALGRVLWRHLPRP